MNKRQKEYYITVHNWLSDIMPDKSRYEITDIMDKLHRAETTLHRISENQCNGHPKLKTEIRDGKMYRYAVEDEKWAKRDEKREESTMKRITEMFNGTPITIDFNGDPRGGAIRLIHEGREMYIDW